MDLTIPAGRLPPTTPSLLDDNARPYFLWWTDATVGRFCAVIVAGLGVFFYASGDPLFRVVSILPALIALVLIYAMVHALFSTRIPAMSIRFGIVPVPRGQPVTLDIVQEGPVHLTSMRVNLVCEVLTRAEGVRKTSYPYQLNFSMAVLSRPAAERSKS